MGLDWKVKGSVKEVHPLEEESATIPGRVLLLFAKCEKYEKIYSNGSKL